MTTIKSTDYFHQNKIKSLHVLRQSIKDSDYDPSQRDGDGNTALHCATIEGNMAVVRFLLEECQLHHLSLNKHQHSLLHLAAAHGHLELVHYLMKDKDLHPLSPDIHGWTPVHYAIAAGHLDIVKLFSEREEVLKSLKKRVINCSKIPYNALHIAISTQNMCITTLLLSCGHGNCTDSLSLLLSASNSTVLQHLIENIDFNITSKRLATFAAVHSGDLKSTVYLTRQFQDYGTDSEGNTLLHVAARNGHWSIVQFLMEDLKIEPNIRGQHNRTPLHYASIEGHIAVIKFLIDNPLTDPMARDEDNHTPLHSAALYGQLSVVKYFISDLLLNPNVKGNCDCTPLHHASAKGHIDVIKFLIDNPLTDPMAIYIDNNTPLHCAALYGQLSVVKYFISDLDLNPNVKGNCDCTPLHYASRKGHIDVVKFLIDNPLTDTMARDQDNNTPLHLSACNKQIDVFKFFIEQLGFDPNMKGMQGWRPLHMASASGDLELVRYLVEDLNCSPSIDDESPLVIAERNGNDDVITYFIKNFPWILDFNQFSKISSSMQDLSINSGTTSNERVDQSSSTKPHDHNISESVSDILYEVSKSNNKATSNPIITEEKHSTEPTFRQHLQKYTQK